MVVESLATEFDIVDIAAAAVQIAHAAVAGDGDDREIPAVTTTPRSVCERMSRPTPWRSSSNALGSRYWTKPR